jgi:hypothetical protein
MSSGGSSLGLGCVANGTIAACTFGGLVPAGPAPYLKAYDANGQVLWSSGDVLNATAYTSAPMIDAAGGVIAADNRTVVRFDASGNVVWRTATPGGLPISPVATQNGVVVLGTFGGPIASFDSATGAFLGSLHLFATIDGHKGRFETTNTPAVRGNRIYVTTEFRLYEGTPGAPDPAHHGRLYAIDVDPTRPWPFRLRVAWFYEFGSGSFASPLLVRDVVYFDAERPAPNSDPLEPQFLAVKDLGTSGQLVWTQPLKAPALASAARDPRGGLWVYARSVPELLRLSETTGAVLQTIPTGSLVPSSAMTVAGWPVLGRPTMILSLTSPKGLPFETHVVALDLVNEVQLWAESTGAQADGMAMGQFPIVQAGASPVVVFTTNARGTWALATQ